jgi:hypothetical protein
MPNNGLIGHARKTNVDVCLPSTAVFLFKEAVQMRQSLVLHVTQAQYNASVEDEASQWL